MYVPLAPAKFHFSELVLLSLKQCCSVAESCPTLQPRGLRTARQAPLSSFVLEFAQILVHLVSDAV